MKKFVFATFATVAMVGCVLSAEYTATLKMVNTKDGKVSLVLEKKGKKGEDPKSITLPAAADVKVFKGEVMKDPDNAKKNIFKAGDEIKGGFKDETFTKIGDKGIQVRVFTDGEGDKEQVTKVLVLPGKKAAGGQ